MLTNFRTLTSAFINGDLTASGVVSASCGNSEEWCSSTTVVQNNSGAWGTGGSFDPTAIQAASGNWNSTYTTVSANSANWVGGGADYDDSWLANLSGNWESTYTTVSSNSADWAIDTVYDDSALQAASGNWESTYTTVSSNSADWDSAYTTVSSNSADWGNAASGNFCSTTVLLNEVSACEGTMSVDGLLSASDVITTTLTADGVYFNTGANRPPELGELVWDETENTLDLGLNNGVVLQIGEEQLINVRAGEEIKDGQVVYASGAFSQGNTGKIVASLYSASSAEGIDPGATDELFFIGVATQDIPQDTEGYITTFGKVRNINVYNGNTINSDIVGPDNVGVGSDPDWPVGTVLYISTSAGRLTNTPPFSPNKVIPAAMVISQSGNGHQRTLFVRQEHGYHIDELHDVRVINPQQNDVLSYNSTLESWDNVTSNNWESTFTTVSTNSADWVTYSTNNISVANWVLDQDTLVGDAGDNEDGSAIKVPTQQSVKFYVDSIVTGINNLKGGYDASQDNPQLDTLPTVTITQGDSYYVTVSGDFFATAVDPGDLLIATIDNATLSGDWVVVNRNIQDELIDRWNSTYTTVSTESANWNSTYTTVSSNSAAWGIDTIYDDSALQAASGNWDSTYNTTLANSANWESTYTTVGTESANWDSTYTTVSTESAAWGIDTIYDDSALQAASGNWDSTYTTVSSNSAAWGIDTVYDDTFLQNASANWESTYTTVSTESANWIGGDYDDTLLQANTGYWVSNYSTTSANSANWDSTYTTVSSNSAAWGIDTIYDDSALQAASANWDSTYTTVFTESGGWDSTYTTVSTESATWSDTSTVVQASSANWESTYTTVGTESANWDSTYTTVNAESANWDSTYTTVSTNSADWVTYSTNNISVANWVLDQDTLVGDAGDNEDGSAIKVPTQQSVKFYVDSIVTGINNLKGGYDAGTNEPNLDSPPTVTITQGDSYYVTVSGDFFATAVDPGDLLIATIDNATLSGDWVVVNRNIQDELIDRWNSNYSTTSANSANWDSTYTTVSTESAAWGIDTIYDDSALQAASGNWDSTYTTVDANSANWDSTYTTVSSNSADWAIDTVYDDSALQAASGNWESTYTTVDANSANWDSTYTTVSSNSADWESTYTTVSTESASWLSNYSTTNANSASWSREGGTELNPDNNNNTSQLALEVVERGTGYIQHDNIIQGNRRGASAVDLQIYRVSADQVAAGPRSSLLGGDSNKIGTSGNYCTIIGGQDNVNNSNYSAIIAGQGNVINSNSQRSIAGGAYSEINHDLSFMFNAGNSSNKFSTVSAETFNVKVNNGMRLVFDTPPEVGQVLTCLETNGIAKWRSLSADEWNSTYTTVQTNSAGWGGTVINSVSTVASNTYTQAAGNTHTIYDDDDVSVTQDIVATLMAPADHTGTSVHKKIGSSHNVVITPPVGATIDGQSSFTLQFENESISIFSDGTNFFIT